jgi:hypothetical protein
VQQEGSCEGGCCGVQINWIRTTILEFGTMNESVLLRIDIDIDIDIDSYDNTLLSA